MNIERSGVYNYAISYWLLYRYANLSLWSPGTTSSTALSVTQSSHVPGRALLEYRDTPPFTQAMVHVHVVYTYAAVPFQLGSRLTL